MTRILPRREKALSSSSPGGLEILDTGPAAFIEDLGRPGLGSVGVGQSGAADRGSFRLANRLVGNAEDQACIEVTFGGLAFRALAALTVAVTGACTPIEVDGRPEPCNAIIRVRRGGVVRLGVATQGLRNYLAIRGGIDVAPVLGSRSYDVMAHLGPAPLKPGTVLGTGPPPSSHPVIELAPRASPCDGDIILRARAGPRDDWFTSDAFSALWTQPFTVTADSNRIGMRLDGSNLPRRVPGELLSEGVVPGSLQAPPSGRLTLFLADHPVTGGYPVIAVVVSRDLDKAAQARPGQRLFFHQAA